MKQNLNDNNLLVALKNSSNFLNELRVNQLSPKQYYELYISIFDSLEYLCNHLAGSYNIKKKKNKDTSFLSDLYELVQYSGNIVPRLYMMIAVGTTFISTGDAPTEAIMKDMIEMCRGVQNPIRGLFLRYYLSQKIKDLLPISNEHEFNNTVEFLINNFIEMNKLWVRLQHQGHSSERELRYKERKELKILVGSNLVRLSQIIDDYNDDHYSSSKFYMKKIFPIITEQIIQCRDPLAQSYLIDVIIQIFPVNFHFKTLNELLNKVILNLNPMLNKSELINTLIDRFINYNDDEINLNDFKQPEDFEILKKSLFDNFWQFYLSLVDQNLPINEHSNILVNYLKLSINFDKDNYENLNKIYQFLSEFNFDTNEGENAENVHEKEEIWLNLLIIPIRNFESIINLLNLPFFSEIFNKLTNKSYQKTICLEILNKLLDTENIIVTSTDDIDIIFKYLLILIKESTEINTSTKLGITKSFKINDNKTLTNDFLTNQNKICKILSKLNHKSTDFSQKVSDLIYIKKKYLNKNISSIIFTYPTLIQLILNNLRFLGVLNKSDVKLVNQFKGLSMILDELYEYHGDYYSDLIVSLYLNLAIVCDAINLSTLTFEIFNKIFIIFEEKLIFGQGSPLNLLNINNNPHDSLNYNSIQYQTIVTVVNKLYFVRNLTKDDYQSLITKVTLYGSKLLKKQDQCRGVFNCSHLFWWTEPSPYQVEEEVETEVKETETSEDPEKAEESEKPGSEKPEESEKEPYLFKDDKRVLECLQKSLRIADSCIDPYLSNQLFIEILNKCLVFEIYGNEMITASYINRLIELIKTNLDNLVDTNNLKDNDDKEFKLYVEIKSFFNRTLTFIEQQKEDEERFLDIET